MYIEKMREGERTTARQTERQTDRWFADPARCWIAVSTTFERLCSSHVNTCIPEVAAVRFIGLNDVWGGWGAGGHLQIYLVRKKHTPPRTLQ